MSKKIIFITIIIISATLTFRWFQHSSQKINPVSDQNTFYSQLNHAFHLAKLPTSSLQVRESGHEVEFSTDQCRVILSTQKDPYRQIASLQQILKTSKIKGRETIFIDLAGRHPYATFQNH